MLVGIILICWVSSLAYPNLLGTKGLKTFVLLASLVFMQSGNLNLPDMAEDSVNVMIYQVSLKLAAKIDIVVLSGAGSKTPMIAERVNSLTGPMLSTRIESKQKDFQERHDQMFNINNKFGPVCG
ncbi:hypothetical protein ACQJBY_024723 [Aegilops geniculata]